MIKIVFFDIDGTLRDRTHRIPDSAKKAIWLLRERDIIPVLATGRCEYEVADVRRELGIDWAITCNGAHIGYKGQTIYGTPFPRERIAQWVDPAFNRNDFLLYAADRMFTTNADSPSFARAKVEIGYQEPVSFESAEELPDIYQCIAFCTEEEEKHYTHGIEDELNIHRWRSWAIDINPKGINKSVGIAKLLDHFSLDCSQAAAFGDGKNDIEMLQFVGRGIAMGNACDELLACTPHVTRAAHEDGILHGVRKHILL